MAKTLIKSILKSKPKNWQENCLLDTSIEIEAFMKEQGNILNNPDRQQRFQTVFSFNIASLVAEAINNCSIAGESVYNKWNEAIKNKKKFPSNNPFSRRLTWWLTNKEGKPNFSMIDLRKNQSTIEKIFADNKSFLEKVNLNPDYKNFEAIITEYSKRTKKHFHNNQGGLKDARFWLQSKAAKITDWG